MKIEWIGEAMPRAFSSTLGKTDCEIAREKCVAGCSAAILLPGFNFANMAACVEALCPKCAESGGSQSPGLPSWSMEIPPPPPASPPQQPPPQSSQPPPPPPPPPPPLKPPAPPVPVPVPTPSKSGSVIPALAVAAIAVGLFVAVVK